MDEHTKDPSVEPPSGSPTGWNPDTAQWTHATLRRATVHGVRLFNSGAYHESHDCFEDEWYNYGHGSVESAFLHGMVQIAAGVYKRVDFGNDDGMRQLFGTASSYLQTVPADFYGLDVDDVRRRARLALETPRVVDDWKLRLDDEMPTATPDDFAYVDELE